MNNQSNKKRLSSIVKATVLGAILSIGGSLIVIVFDHFCGGNFLILLDVPTGWLNHFTGWDQASAGSFVQSEAFCVLVNGLLGAAIFLLIAIVWQIVLKGIYEQK